MKRQFIRMTMWLCLLLLTAPLAGPLGAGRAAALETPDKPPFPQPPAALTLAEDTAVTFALIASDDQSPVTFAVATPPQRGTVALVPRSCDGTGPYKCVTMATYTPNPNTNGSDSFTYTVSDGTHTSEPMPVTLNVTPVNDPPSAVRLKVQAYRGLPLTILLEGRDVDGDRLTFSVSAVVGGTLSPLPEPVCVGGPVPRCNVQVGFEPLSSQPDRASFVYTVSDGQVSSRPAGVEIQYSDVPPALPTQQESTAEDTPIDITLRATDPDSTALTYGLLGWAAHGSLGPVPAPTCTPDGTGGTACTAIVRYTPDPQYSGTDSFYYQTSDGTAPVLHRVAINVTPVADPPVLQAPPTLTVTQNETVRYTLTASDLDGPADTLTYALVNTPEGVTINPTTGEMSWTPTAAVLPGDYTFVARVTDSSTPPLFDEKPVKVTVKERDADLTASTVTATPTSLDADGTSTAAILVTLRDAAGQALTQSHGQVLITSTAGSISNVTDHQNGTYSATFTAATTGGTAIVRAYLANRLLTSTATVEMRGLPSPYGTVVGEVRAPGGALLPNLPVRLATGSGQVLGTATTNAQGTYRFANVAPGTYTVLVPTADVSRPAASAPVTVTANVETRQNLQVTSRGSLTVRANITVLSSDAGTATITVQAKRANGAVLSGADLQFETTDGTLPRSATTNQNGTATVTLTAPRTAPGEFRTVTVRVVARHDGEGLFTDGTVSLLVSPVAVQGIVLDARTGRPISGAVAEIRADLDGDRTADFTAQVTTGADGRYRIAVPEVNRTYHVDLSVPVTVENRTDWVTATQTARVPANPGYTVYADRQVSGRVLLRDGRTGSLRTPDWPEALTGTVLNYYDDVSVDRDGTFDREVVASARTYQILFRHVLPDGTEMAGTVVTADVSQAGALAVITAIIDPYAVVRDSNNQPLSGVTMELYYADTYRNRQAGHTPHTLVTLPDVTDLDTRWSTVPQNSTSTGRYGWLLYPDTDYYVKARKSGYEAYDSRTSGRYVLSTAGTDSYAASGIISVGTSLAKLDIRLRRLSEVEPPAPASVGARTEPGRVLVSWQSVSGAKSYTVYRAREGSSTYTAVASGLRSNSFVDDDVTPGVTYMYKVAAANDSTEGQTSGSVSVRAPEAAPPATPTEPQPPAQPEPQTPEPPVPPVTEPTPAPAPALVHRAYIMGYPDGTFQPNRSISRAEAAAVLARVLQIDGQTTGLAPHSDVPAGHWANLYIAIVAERGLMRGDPDGRFRPDAPITRAEVATIAARLKNLAPESRLAFTDISGHWAAGWIGAAYQAGYVKGYPEGDFRPEAAISRAEFVTVVNRLERRGPLVGRPTAKWPDVPASHWAHGQVEEASVSHEADLPFNEAGAEIWRKDSN